MTADRALLIVDLQKDFCPVGAQFHPCLRLPMEAIIISKGMDPAKESYSALIRWMRYHC